MNKQALFHRTKSEYAYAYDKETLHILLRTAKNDFESVQLLWGDPYEWQDGKWICHHTMMTKRYQTELFDFYFVAIKPPLLRVKYSFLMKDEKHYYHMGSRKTGVIQLSDTKNLYDMYHNYFNFPFVNYEDVLDSPSWVKDTVWYQIFPDRFATTKTDLTLPWGKLPVSNDEIYGGNLKGITEKLDYLHNLGITGIYFTPLFESPSAHKYDTTDYFKIDPSFGTNEDFKVMVEKAHHLGIKVMLDGVFNHAGYDHPFFQDVIKNGKDSKYKNAFFIHEFPFIDFNIEDKSIYLSHFRPKFDTFAFTPRMPKWHTADPLVSKHLLDCIAYWIEEFDIDGWRLDVSNEISHQFLRKIRETARRSKQDVFLLGENWDASMPWLSGDQLDAVMNYEWSHAVWAFLEHRSSASEFIEQMTLHLVTTPDHIIQNMFNCLDSHDTVRIRRRLQDDTNRFKIAMILLFISAGSPSVYYGNEVGMTGENDPDNRRCMIWDTSKQDYKCYDFVHKLIMLREKHTAFKQKDMYFIENEGLILSKSTDQEKIVYLINNSSQVITMSTHHISGFYINLLTNRSYEVTEQVKMAPYESILLKEI